MEDIVLKKIAVKNNRVEYICDIPPRLKGFFNGENLFIEFPDDCVLEKVPEAVLAVPFVGTMLGIAIFCGGAIVVD